MDCKIMKKEAFTVICRAKTFKYEDAVEQVPRFWAEHFGTGGGKAVCGMYGINLDESMGGNEFEYLIADNYDPAKKIPEGFTHPHHPGPHLGGVPLHRTDAPGAPGAEPADLLPVAAPRTPTIRSLRESTWNCTATPASLRVEPRIRTTTVRSGFRWKRNKRLQDKSEQKEWLFAYLAIP